METGQQVRILSEPVGNSRRLKKDTNFHCDFSCDLDRNICNMHALQLAGKMPFMRPLVSHTLVRAGIPVFLTFP